MSQDLVKRASENDETTESALLPDIVDHVTLEIIAPMLSWRDVRLLFAASTAWRRAIRDHRVYDVRVRLNATEKLFVVLSVKYEPETSFRVVREHKISLYFPGGKCWHELSPFPGFGKAIPFHCQCVSLNGAIYILGGSKDALDEIGSTEVYVLDLAGHQSQWRRCADMQEPRTAFAVGVMDGKIFAIGGLSRGRRTRECEEYDPEVDAWSRIEPITADMYSPRVVTLGKELLVYANLPNHALAEAEIDLELLVRIDEVRRRQLNETSDADAEVRMEDAFAIRVNLREADEVTECSRLLARVYAAVYTEAYDSVMKTWRVVDRLERNSLRLESRLKVRHFATFSNNATATMWPMSL